MNEPTVAEKIDQRIAELDGWRGQLLAKIRRLIHEADPEVVEEWKWVTPTKPGVPVWSHNGIICVGESYKDHLKINFLKGGQLPDPAKVFPQYDGDGRRGLDIFEGNILDEAAFSKLIREAVKLNLSK